MPKEMKTGEIEANKFKLLHSHEGLSCCLRNPENFKLYSGPLMDKGKKLNTIKFCPIFASKNFIPRYEVQYNLVNILINERDPTKLLMINGEMGCGKSTMLRAIGNFFNNRDYFDSVIYMDLRSVATQEEFAALFFDFL